MSILCNDEISNIYKFSRYLYRTVKIRKIADFELNKDIKKGIFPNEMFSLYYALLYTLVESYKTYKLTDRRIDILIGASYANNIKLLFDHRNSIFHPETRFDFPREMEVLKNAKSIIPWAYALTDEFERMYYFFPEYLGLACREAEKLRRILKSINNWLPCNSLKIKKERASNRINKNRERIKKNIPQYLDEFDNIIKEFNEIIKKTPDSYFEDLLNS